MATTPHAPDPPKHQGNDKPRPAERAPEKAPLAAGRAAAKEAPQFPSLAKDTAWPLFYNGHRIAKQGDPPDKWISMGRAGDGLPVVTSPMTPEIEEAVKGGEYYLVPDQAAYDHVVPPAPPTTAPTNVDVPMVSAMDQLASCTMGNWNGEPTSYAYAWQRNGTPISGATASNYTMVSGDSGKPIGCIVTATNAAGSTAAPLSNTVTAP